MALLLFTRAIVLFLVGSLSLLLYPLNATYPYLDKIAQSSLPQSIYTWAGFDGVHYVGIAMQGYHEFDQAFFPLYPQLIRFVEIFVKDYVLSGLLIANAAFIGAIYIIYRYVTEFWGEQRARWIIFFILAYPTAFYFSAVYSESLFLLYTVASLYSLHKRRFMLAGILAILASLTRLQGVLLIIPIFFSLYPFAKPLKKHIVVLTTPLLGLALYMSFLYKTTGDALYFLTSQASFGAQRSAELILLPQVYYRYLKIFLTADYSFQYAVALMEVIFVTGSLAAAVYVGYKAYVKKEAYIFGLVIYSAAHLILPTLTGSFSSLPRYSLFAVTNFIVLSSLSSQARMIALSIFIVLQCILAGLFIHGSFIS